MTRNGESIFHEARELSGVARDAFLQGACGRDAALRARVDALLAADSENESFLETVDPGTVVTADPHAPAALEQAGQTIGRYKLLQEIGEGGFGTVYMAEQQEPVRRKVALKVIKLGMDTRQVIARFEAERQALALMDHPNIARVLDAGSTESGRPYFVMELVRGEAITEYCDKHNLPTPERLALFLEVCHAIQHAHQKGVIHRDIKPSNVLVTLHDGRPVPKIIDFGIAKATNQRLTEKTLFTEFRQLIGTPDYMSPEQAEMSGLDVDTRTDIYSLGVMLYELLTGTTPFDRKSLAAAGYGEMQRMIREVEPPRPSTRLSTLGEDLDEVARHRQAEPGRLRRLLSGDLDCIVMKAMEKDRTRRYETANGLAMDVSRYLADEPVVAGPPTAAYRVRKFVHRNRPMVIGVSLVTSAMFIGLTLATIGLWQSYRAASERENTLLTRARADIMRIIFEGETVELAVLPFTNLGDEESDYFAAGLAEELIADLESVRTVHVSSGPAVMRYRNSTRPLAEIARELGMDILMQGSVLRTGRNVHVSAQLVHAVSDLPLWSNTYEGDSRDTLALRRRIFQDIADEIRPQLSPDERERLAPKRRVHPDAHEAYLKGRFALHRATGAAAHEAIRYFDTALEIDPEYAMAYVAKAEAYRCLEENYESPMKTAPKARAAALAALRIDPTLAEAHVALGNVQVSHDWDWEAARVSFETALELNPNLAIGHVFLASYLTAMGRCSEAMEAIKKARALDPVLLPRYDGFVQFPYNCREFDLALEHADAGIELGETWPVHSWKGLVLSALGRRDEAIASLEHAWILSGEKPETRSPVVAEFLGGTYALAGRVEDAEAMLEELDRQEHVEKRYVCPYEVATIFVAYGDYIRRQEASGAPINRADPDDDDIDLPATAEECDTVAFAWFHRAIDERSACVPWLQVDIRLDSLRDDPRFTELLIRSGHVVEEEGSEAPGPAH